jgi:hypothetical protein
MLPSIHHQQGNAMFTIFFTNIGYGPSQKFETVDDALAYGKSK